MFCALNGATLTPCRCSQRQMPAVSTLLPASDVVPATSSPPLTARPPADPTPHRPATQPAGRAPARARPGGDAARPTVSRPRPAASPRAARPTAPEIRAARFRCRASGRGPSPRNGPDLGAPEVDVAPAEPDAERAGHRRLALPGVGARVVVAVPPPHPPGPLAVAVRDRRDGDGEQPGQPGRHQVEQVVEPGGRGAEPGVPRRPVPDHRVEGVRRPVAEQPGQAGDRAPDQRGDHRVGGVLGDRLDGGAGQLRLVQGRTGPGRRGGRGVAGRRAGRRRAGARPMTRGLVPQGATAQHRPGAGGHQRRPGHRVGAGWPRAAATPSSTGTPTASAVNAAPAGRSGR